MQKKKLRTPEHMFRLACKKGDIDTVKKYLNDNKTDPTTVQNYGFRIAVKQNHIGIVKLLLSDNRINPIDKECSAIKLALIENHVEMINFLYGLQIFKDNIHMYVHEWLIKKVRDDDIIEVKSICNNHINIIDINKILHIVALNNRVEIFEFLLDLKPDLIINETCDFFLYAIEEDNYELLEIALQSKNKDKHHIPDNAIYKACDCDSSACLIVLLRNTNLKVSPIELSGAIIENYHRIVHIILIDGKLTNEEISKILKIFTSYAKRVKNVIKRYKNNTLKKIKLGRRSYNKIDNIDRLFMSKKQFKKAKKANREDKYKPKKRKREKIKEKSKKKRKL